jgi:hypothetical protein
LNPYFEEFAMSAPDALPTPQDLKLALKAFKKRLKLMRLDDESKFGRSPMSGGGSSGVIAITPPDQYPQAVWDELVKQGRLKTGSSGLYELVGP